MIAMKPESMSPDELHALPMVNIGRPSFFNKDHARLWKMFHAWVVETEIPIYVSGVFHMVKDMLDKGTMYGGNGFKYCFWFNNEEDKAAFERFVAEWTKKWDELIKKEREEKADG